MNLVHTNSDSKNNQHTNELQSGNNGVTMIPQTLRTLKRAIQEFELEMQKDNELFDVYEFLSSYLGYTETTIRHWFSQHTKLGAEDMVKVCLAIKNLEPIRVYRTETGNIFDHYFAKPIEVKY